MPQGKEELGLQLAEVKRQLRAAENRVAELEATVAARSRSDDVTRHQPSGGHYAMFDNLLEGCQVIGFDWRYLYINDAAARHGSQTRGGLLGRTMMEKYPGIENTELFAVFRSCMDERVERRLENHFTYPDGTDAWFELSIRPATEGIIILSLDISKHKRAEIAEWQAEKRQLRYHASLQDNVTDAVIVTDLDFRIQSWNRAAERIYGWSSEEVQGKNAVDVLRTRFDDGERERLIKLFREQGWWQGEVVQHRKDGAPINILGSVTLAKDENDVPIGVVSVNHDITARKRAENTLRESEALYRLLAENITDVVARSSTDGTCLYVSPSCKAIMGYEPEELVGRPSLELFHPDDLQAVTEAYATALQNGAPVIVSTYRFLHKDGHYFWLESVGRPIHSDTTGEITGVITSSRDITVRREAEEALRVAFEKERELGELKSRFVSMASHEFRTPLASILALTETLSVYRHKLTDDQIDARFGKIKDQINHLKAIMEDVLLLAKMQARRVEFAPVLFDLDALSRSVLDEFVSQPNMAHNIEYHCESSLKHVLLDKKLVRQIINNLVSNALKYSSEGTTVSITLQADDQDVVIKVSDQGIGIPEADLPHLFEAFHRSSNVGASSGTGLGLIITKESIELHGGTITLESQVNQGTTIFVRLPMRTTKGSYDGENSGY